MRIVDVCEFYSPHGGGVRTYVDRKLTLLTALGHDPIVLAPAAEDRVETRAAGGTVMWMKAPSLPVDAHYRMFWQPDAVRRRLSELKPDIVEASSPWRPAWIVGGWQGDAVKVFFLHGDPIASYAYRWFEHVASQRRIENAFEWFNRYLRRAARQFDDLVVCGPSLQRRMLGRKIAPVTCVPLGIDKGAFSPALRDEALRASWLAQCALPPFARLLIGVGRHHAEKRWPMVIRAAQAAAAQTPLGLILIGRGVDTAAVAKEAGANPHIKLFEPVYDRPQLARVMASADALIHGCETETFGLVAYEALASGTPLIVPKEGGCAEIAYPTYAETFEPNDARSAARAILAFCQRNPIDIRHSATAASALVRSDRDHARDLAAHYQGLLERRRRRAA